MTTPAQLHITNQIYLTLAIQNQDFGGVSNLISTISINESVMFVAPIMQFTFDDTSSELVRSLALTEGTKLKLMLGKVPENSTERKFRLFGFNQHPTRLGPQIVANFIFDCPQYITGSYIESFEDVSSAMMQKIASSCSLKSSVDDTNDSMVWLNFGQTRATFVEDCAMYGYVDDSSCMFRAVTSEGVLLYYNMAKRLNENEPVAYFDLNVRDDTAATDAPAFIVRDLRDISSAGAMNSWINYGWNYIQHSMTGKEVVHSKYDAQTKGKYLPINKEVKDLIHASKVEYCPKLDCGNTHPKYIKAYYNNMRGKALMSEKIQVLIESVSNVQLLDVVEYRHIETDGNAGKASGKYIVTSKVTYIKGGVAYYEKFELCRASLKEAGNTPLVG